jgi:Raf kinase inhibitor-like YbhB/YbcL family protein
MKRATLAIAFATLIASEAGAQNPPPGTPPGQPSPSGARGGGGRGRGGVRVMTLTTSGFTDGGVIPAKHAQNGDELSPPLSWTGAPDSTKSFVLIVHDLDQIGGNGDDVLHWLAWNIPGTATSLPQGVPHGPEAADGMRQISVSGPYYRGPAAPQSGPRHHYVFELYALDTTINVAPVGQSPSATRAAVVAAMAGHVRAKGVLVGLYKRAD